MKHVFKFSVQLCPKTNLILRRNERDMIKNVYWSSCEVPGYSCQMLVEVVSSRQIFENITSNFVKIRPVGAELSHADGRRDGQT